MILIKKLNFLNCRNKISKKDNRPFKTGLKKSKNWSFSFDLKMTLC